MTTIKHLPIDSLESIGSSPIDSRESIGSPHPSNNDHWVGGVVDLRFPGIDRQAPYQFQGIDREPPAHVVMTAGYALPAEVKTETIDERTEAERRRTQRRRGRLRHTSIPSGHCYLGSSLLGPEPLECPRNLIWETEVHISINLIVRVANSHNESSVGSV